MPLVEEVFTRPGGAMALAVVLCAAVVWLALMARTAGPLPPSDLTGAISIRGRIFVVTHHWPNISEVLIKCDGDRDDFEFLHSACSAGAPVVLARDDGTAWLAHGRLASCGLTTALIHISPPLRT